jgi:hypothetical protein
MNTSNYDLSNHHDARTRIERFTSAGQNQPPVFDEEHFATPNSTPLGQLLKLIGSLPEIRHEKVDEVRNRIDGGRYDVNRNLDAALDKVLEEFLMDD